MSDPPPPGRTPAVERLIGALQRAAGLQRAGRLTEAIALYRRIIAAAPGVAEAHNNLAVALAASGARGPAIASYRRAVALQPNYAVARANLGALLVENGEVEAGLEELAAAYLTNRGNAGMRERLLGVLGPLEPAQAGPRLAEALDRLAADPAVDLQRLAGAGAALLRAKPEVGKAIADPAAGLEAAADALAAPLPRALLGDALIADAGVEALLTGLRRHWLDTPPSDSGLVASVALQAQASEWVWDETPDETARLKELDAGTAGAGDDRLLIHALYRPLGGLPQAEALADATGRLAPGPRRLLLQRALVEPRDEAALAAALPALTPIRDPVSRRVRAQYEENAYPRWRRLGQRPARPLGAVLAGLLPGPLPQVAQAPRVLVAGCGTGRHALATATRYAGAQVLAVDLSRAALGFAARQARDHGIENIAFAQADILGLGELDRRFDLVECSGTLHHMADPEAGWRVLRGLVAPGGLMRIGLYSARGRAGVVAGRAEIARLGLEPTPEGIRAARRALRTLPPDSPVHPLTESADFYSLSGCRDLFFHVQETRFDLARIERALDALDLGFLGFELPSPALRSAFRARFPDAEAERDLGAWDAFEAANPLAFAAMYQFWCHAL